MEIQPLNRYLVVSLQEQQNEGSSVLVPEEYKIADRHSLATVKNISDDCKLNVSVGDQVIVETAMVQAVSLGQEKVCLVLENYVFCVVKSDD